ncbi:MAG: aminopeptidase P family protein [Oscillospiraceae bacterium]|nr:aminopeptidase P family protein [Oscillospiraceae bacterium]
MTVNEKIAKVRALMAENHIDALIIPGADPHLSEYFSHHWATVTYISGFTGEAGTFCITKDVAGLWTDGRFYTQADIELSGTDAVLFRASEPETPTIAQYLCDNLPSGSTVGINGTLFSAAYVKGLQEKFAAKGIALNSHADYANDIWEERPAEEHTVIYLLPEQFSGKSAADKLSELRRKLLEEGADALLISRLDNIAWLYNIRANDVLNNPVVISYAYVSQTEAKLYTDCSRLPLEVAVNLADNGVLVLDYEDIFSDLATSSQSLRLLCDESEANFNLYAAAAGNPNFTMLNKVSPIPLMKALKNEVETENTYKAYLYDGCAEAEFYAWLEEEMEAGTQLTEWDLSEKIHQLRMEQPDCKGDSFNAIIAYKENAAMMHYGPTAEKCKKLEKEGLLLNDSGGQYLWGTTDATRTIALGAISDEERRDFTLVLRSVIDLTNACWLEGTSGKELDILSRNNLWQLGINYRCGTGHGVGYLLNVHEGPQSFKTLVPLQEGMVLTIEPGVYTEGSHGVRTENTVVVRKGEKTEYGQFYHFETFTVVPIDTNCLDMNLLEDSHIDWINSYHAHVLATVGPHVSERAQEWLQKACMPIDR